MSEKSLPYKRTVLCLILVFFSFFAGLLKFSDFIGINLGNAGDDKVSIFVYCLGFISLLLALRFNFLHISYFKKIYGVWTIAGKARWRYCFIGAITVAFICLLIDYLHIPRFITMLLEFSTVAGVTIYFYVKYVSEFSNDFKNLTNAIKSKSRNGEKGE